VTRILVTGSRTWDDALVLAAALAEAAQDEPVTVVHGACPSGADRLADVIATATGWTVERHPARWGELGKRAGFVRNAHMVNLGADVCLAFIRDGSRGASHTAALAEDAGIRTVRYVA
jgi:hypothetical protein